jgi:hypothetical protein
MESLSWQLPAYITIGVIGGGMAVGLLVICVICGFCSIFNRKYDNEEREKRKVSLQAIAIKTDKRPVDRLYCTPSSRSILLTNSPGKPLRSDNGPIFPTGDDQKEEKKGINLSKKSILIINCISNLTNYMIEMIEIAAHT